MNFNRVEIIFTLPSIVQILDVQLIIGRLLIHFEQVNIVRYILSQVCVSE